jgi:excisionase family DNA binding protein
MNADQQTIEPLLLSSDEAAKTLGISIRLLQSLNSSGRLPLPVRLGRRCLWSREELTEWIRYGSPSREKWQIIKGTKNV